MDSYDPTVIFLFLLVLRECKEISVVIGDENPPSAFDDSSEKTQEATYFEFSGPWSARSQQGLTTDLRAVVLAHEYVMHNLCTHRNSHFYELDLDFCLFSS